MLSDFYPPLVGGMEKHVESLSRKLVDRGHNVMVCTSWHQGLQHFDVVHGVEVTRIEGLFQKTKYLYGDSARRYPPPTYDCLTARKLESLIREHKPELIHVHGWILYSALPLRQKLKIPIVVTLHDYGLVCPKRTFLLTDRNVCKRPFTIQCVKCAREDYGFAKSLATSVLVKRNRKNLRNIDKYFAVSSFVKEVHCKYLNLQNEDVAIIPNFCDDYREPDSGLERLPNDFILFVGSLNPSKGVDTLLDAYSKLKTNIPLVLIGARDRNHSYRQPKNVIVHENASDSLVAEGYRKCRFVIIPSIFPDPCPTVALETMSKGKAVIASAIGGLTDIVKDGETGILVRGNESTQLTNAISYLLNNTNACAIMGENGNKRFRALFSADVVVPQIEKQYETIATLR